MLLMTFVELLARTPEADPLWVEFAAGMLIARIADDVLRFGSANEGSREYARRYLIQVENSDTKEQLRGLFDETAPGKAHGNSVAVRLVAYGVKLHLDGRYALAADVFSLMTEQHCEPDLRMQAMLRRAFALRLMDSLDDADEAYVRLLVFAATAGDRRMQLEAELGLARVLFHRGNIPEAEKMMTAVAAAAHLAGQNAVFANVSIDLAGIAGEQNKPELVLFHSANALKRHGWAEGRERVFVNAAFALRELDRASGARRAAQYVVKKGNSEDQRANAMLVLYALATDARSAREAHECRCWLAAAKLIPRIAVEYYQAVAREHAMFDRFAKAEVAARKMLAVAEDHRLNKMIIAADEALCDISVGKVPAIYLFRPTVPTASAQSVDEMESSVLALCTV